MKKRIIGMFFILICAIVMCSAANAGTGNERTWCFQNSEFTDISNGVITTPVTKNGLTLSNDIEIIISKSPVKTLYFTRAIYTKAYGSINSGYLKFSVNGDTDIHILGRSKSNEVSRNLTIYTTADGMSATVTMTPKTDDYVYKYRGSAGDVYLYTAGDGVKIFSISAKDYDINEYAPFSEGTKKVWDFENYKSYMGTINESKNIDGMQIKAALENTMAIGCNDGSKEPYGYMKSTYLDLSGRIRYEGRYITFPVNRDSDLYITARSADGINTRNLLLWNKYYGTPNTSLSNDIITVNGSITTYKISYYGDGEDFMLGSEDSGIRIYKVSVVPRVNKVIDYKKWDISNNSSFAVGTYTNSTIDGLNLINATIENNTATGSQKAIHIRSGIYGNKGRIKFNISDSSKTRGAAIKRTITIKAKSASYEEMKLVLISSDDMIIGCTDLTTNIAEYKFDYTGSYDSIYVYSYYPSNSNSYGAYIYSIDNGVTGPVGPEDSRRTVSVTKGQKYQYYFTAGNIDADVFTYKISYNKDALNPKYIGYGDGADNYSSDGINIIKNENGEIVYTIENTNSNWSGITVSVIFEAKSSGNTTIEYIAEQIS